jgi:hypothetical protein
MTTPERLIEYEQLAKLERETTQMRHTTFTALISISFLLPGFAAHASGTGVPIVVFGHRTSVSALAFLLGLFFYIFTVAHYSWYHRYSHRYRAKLKELEDDLGMEIYKLRVRPTIGRMKFHFDWLLFILGIAYLVATIAYVGWFLTVIPLAAACAIYLGLLIWSVWWDVEPLEH